MTKNSAKRAGLKPFIWIAFSFFLTFFFDFGSYTPQFMALSIGSLVFLGEPQLPLTRIFLIAFFCDVAFHRPFGFYGLIFLAEVMLAERFRYRFSLASPFMQGVSVMAASFCIQLYEAAVFYLLHRSLSLEYLLGGSLISGVLWPVYSRFSWYLRSVEPLSSYE